MASYYHIVEIMKLTVMWVLHALSYRQIYSCEWVEVRRHRFVLRSHRTTQPTIFSWSNWCVTVGTSKRHYVPTSPPSATVSWPSTKESTIWCTTLSTKLPYASPGIVRTRKLQFSSFLKLYSGCTHSEYNVSFCEHARCCGLLNVSYNFNK